MDFHKYYFDLKKQQPVQATISSPHVRIMGNVAIVCYNRLIQKVDQQGSPYTIAVQETRVWEKQNSNWKLVHLHRS